MAKIDMEIQQENAKLQDAVRHQIVVHPSMPSIAFTAVQFQVEVKDEARTKTDAFFL